MKKAFWNIIAPEREKKAFGTRRKQRGGGNVVAAGSGGKGG